MPQKNHAACQTRRPIGPFEAVVPKQSLVRAEMRREDLMSPDLLSEIVLLAHDRAGIARVWGIAQTDVTTSHKTRSISR